MNKSKEEIARNYHKEGCNCAQAVLLAFAEDFDLSLEDAAKIALPFGGGMARGETCGALTGALMVLGLTESGSVPPTPEDKVKNREKTKKLAETFEEKYKTTLCREILATPEGKGKALCNDLVGYMASQLENLLNK
ncbi:MAG: C_GCAxxG_C_C family protein [Clostridia bacterium]|nr:C_GCAxxG_C_C family protein [Clostridia bacterium]